jgi:hypothetical protein
MLKKAFGLASLLLLITFLGAACAPAASQQDLQSLQYQVQALSLSLATTQSNLAATQEALRNMQNQNEQLQNQLNKASSQCTTCDKTAQACVNNNLLNPYGCVGTSPYCYSPYTYPPPCTPVAFPPYWWPGPYCFFPHPHGTHCGPDGHHPPAPPFPNPPPQLDPPSLVLPHPITPDVVVDIPVVEPMPSGPIIPTDHQKWITPEIMPIVTDSIEQLTESIRVVESAPQPVEAVNTWPANVPDPVLEPKLSTRTTTEYPVITEIPAMPVPKTPAPEWINARESKPETMPIMTDVNKPLSAPEPGLVAFPQRAVTPNPALEIPAAPAVMGYPVITKAPAISKPATLDTVKTIDEINADST